MRYFLPAIGAFLVGCGGDCVALPCAMPIGLSLTITSANGALPIIATVDVTGRVQTTVPCTGTCMIPGPAGAYQLKVSAAGFQTATVSATVTGSDGGKCGCPTVDQQHLDIKLNPAT